MTDNAPSDTYREEVKELTGRIEACVLSLEKNHDRATLDDIFRAMHTIKGSGSMFGFTDIARFTHELESLYDAVRKDEIDITKELADVTLEAVDHIRVLMGESGMAEPPEKENAIFRKIFALKNSSRVSSGEGIESQNGIVSVPVTYRIRFKPARDIFLRGGNPLTVLGELMRMGTCNVCPHWDDLPALPDMNPELCYMAWTIILTTTASKNEIADVFMFVEEGADISIDGIATPDETWEPAQPSYKRIGDILVERGDISRETVDELARDKKMIGELVVEKGLVKPENVAAALAEQKHVLEQKQKSVREGKVSTIRVKNDKLDELSALVGELVILQAQVSQKALTMGIPDFIVMSEQLDRLASGLRENSMALRMIPMGELYGQFNRLVRDLSGNLGKSIELVTLGSETELDKNLIEQLKDPLIHILRNSVDHGIETQEKRAETGKPKKGVITISAEHVGSFVHIKVIDDGAGLDSEKIRRKAISNGMIRENAEYSESELFDLVFLPGFSTAEKTTDISGRGVGMDVVRKNIERLNGSVTIESVKGVGTTITLKVPLTLAIIDGLLLEVDCNYYILNISVIEECIELVPGIIDREQEKQIANYRGEIFPYVDLRNYFQVTSKRPPIEQLIITAVEGQKFGLVVDRIVRKHQTVIKSVGKVFSHVAELSGASILGDGTVAFVLDVQRLARIMEDKQRTEFLARAD